ncbi:MAG: response regulator transcription factor [Clostridiales Family XIII bacterium]|jgi:two-component system alkaline phosphatase synthesis response regulator PhoP|nr:response regulator transcription factor [Clostridiales Family XIII bacterium]
MKKIYILEDDDDIRELVRYALDSADFEAVGFPDPESFEDALREGRPDLLILDIMLPGKDGITLLRELKSEERTRRLPVILLTAKTSEYDRIIGLDSGADDYVAKPFSVMELISRVRAVLRRTDENERVSTSFSTGPIMVNLDKRTVFVDDESIFFTNKEFQLLYYLMQKEGAVVSRHELMEQVWGYGHESESRTVDVHIKTIRQKLGRCGPMIKTIRSVGYMLEAVV